MRPPPRLLIPHLLLLTVSGSLAAVELPIVSVTIGPDGAVVERAGDMPRDDELVTGLPIGIDATRLTLTVAGLDTPPAVRLELPKLAPLPPADPAWLTRLATAQAAFDAAQPALDLAALRIHFAEAVLNLFPAPAGSSATPPDESDESDQSTPRTPEPELSTFRPSTIGQAVPSPAIQTALVEFVSANITTAHGERAAALRARGIARSQLIALDEEREQQRPIQQLAASVRLPGSAGRQVRLRYVVERAAWAPAYRLEVVLGVVTLVHEAIIDVPRDQQWNHGLLYLTTRQPSDDLVLRDLQVPVLELGDEVVAEREYNRRRAVTAGGGSKSSESAVETSMRAQVKAAAADGSWPAGSWTTHATALNLLSFLGAGYDHKTPNKYRATLARGIQWLTNHRVAQDLAGQILVTLTLAEAYALTADETLKPSAEFALAVLTDRVVNRHELEIAIFRRGPLAGPELLAWTAIAAKSAQVAGLDGALCGSIYTVIDELLPDLDGHADRDEAHVTRLAVDAFRGRLGETYGHQPPVSEWLERLPGWIQEGRPELVYFANLGLFQCGGDSWGLWNTTARERLVALNNVGTKNGWLAASPHPLGENIAMPMLTLPLQVYYRYAQVSKGAASGINGIFANRGSAMTLPELPPLPNLAQAAQQWPLRIAAGPARLVDGQRVRIMLNRTVLPGHISLRAAPAEGPGAWRWLATSNPLAVPLLSGEAVVVVDGEQVGACVLPFTEPGKPLSLALGRDDRVQIARSEERSDDEAWGKRTRTYTIGYRIDAPVGLYADIRLDESMPTPKDGSIQLVSLTPPLAGEELDRRLVEDPVWHLDVDLKKTPAVAKIVWQIRYPATVKPQVHTIAPEAPETENPPPDGFLKIPATDHSLESQPEGATP